VQDPVKPTLTVFRKRIVRETQLKTRTLQPAKIISYEDLTSTATIELAHQTVERGSDGNTEIARVPKVIKNVPVVQLGSDSSYLRLPLEPGTTGLALVSDRSLGAWRVDGEAHPPPLPHLHNLADCVFLAGVRADSNPLPPATMGGAVLEATTIQLGIGATLGAARVTDPTIADSGMVTFMTAISTAFSALGAIPTNAPAAAACAAVASAQASAQANFGKISTGSTKVFVE
jgi:hypothetical protein